jgi:hypothetical protein
VPAESRALKTKPVLALKLVQRARHTESASPGSPPMARMDRIGLFCGALEDAGETFLVDVYCDQRVFLQEPHGVAAKTSQRIHRSRTCEWTNGLLSSLPRLGKRYGSGIVPKESSA